LCNFNLLKVGFYSVFSKNEWKNTFLFNDRCLNALKDEI
tara:strand:+ start:643 stop:759 length:117 start_codon:yes stop_codon:yes gene_type:complete